MHTEVNFTADFGGKIVEVICPHCLDSYHVDERNLHSNITDCWKCNKQYLQKASTSKTPRYISEALHRVKGEK